MPLSRSPESAGLLYEIEHGKKNTFESLTGMVRARDHLRAALSALQAPEMNGSFPPECADTVASSLAIVFSAAKGGDWKGRETLSRARKRALLMRLPPDDDRRGQADRSTWQGAAIHAAHPALPSCAPVS